jgi:hypothetical protein
MNDAAPVQPREQAQGVTVIRRIQRFSHLHRFASHVAALEHAPVPRQQSRNTIHAVETAQRVRFTRSGPAGKPARPPARRGNVATNQQHAMALDTLDAAELVGFEEGDGFCRRVVHAFPLVR